MAKIKLGMAVVDIRGKLGGHVFAKNRGGNYVRTKSTPSNPQTTAQSAVRGMFGAIASGWSALTESERLSFRNKVSQYTGTDIFGDIRTPSGKNLHHKLNQNLVLTGQAQISICPDPENVPYSQLAPPQADTSAGTFSVPTQGNTAGCKIMVFATAPLSQGTKFVKNKLRKIGIFDGANGASLDVKAAYEAKFGAVINNSNIVVGVKVVNSNGQAGAMETSKVVFA